MRLLQISRCRLEQHKIGHQPWHIRIQLTSGNAELQLPIKQHFDGKSSFLPRQEECREDSVLLREVSKSDELGCFGATQTTAVRFGWQQPGDSMRKWWLLGTVWGHQSHSSRLQAWAGLQRLTAVFSAHNFLLCPCRSCFHHLFFMATLCPFSTVVRNVGFFFLVAATAQERQTEWEEGFKPFPLISVPLFPAELLWFPTRHLTALTTAYSKRCVYTVGQTHPDALHHPPKTKQPHSATVPADDKRRRTSVL